MSTYMTDHPEPVMRHAALAYAQLPGLSPPEDEEPSEWELGGGLRPGWIDAAAPPEAAWALMAPAARIEMPLIRPADLAAAAQIAKRRSEESLAWAAVLKDVVGVTHGRIARDDSIMLAWDDVDLWRSRPAQRYVEDGRKLLHARGVAPWAVWEQGKVPKRWGNHSTFLTALDTWICSSLLRAARELERPSLFRGLKGFVEAWDEAERRRADAWVAGRTTT